MRLLLCGLFDSSASPNPPPKPHFLTGACNVPDLLLHLLALQVFYLWHPTQSSGLDPARLHSPHYGETRPVRLPSPSARRALGPLRSCPRTAVAADAQVRTTFRGCDTGTSTSAFCTTCRANPRRSTRARRATCTNCTSASDRTFSRWQTAARTRSSRAAKLPRRDDRPEENPTARHDRAGK